MLHIASTRIWYSASLAAILFAGIARAAEAVSFTTQDGGVVHALVYGNGQRGVVLAHGGRLNKQSWQLLAESLASSGFHVLAFDFRGHGQSRGGPASRSPDEARHLDVLAAVAYLRNAGAKSIAVIGASMGGDYAATACEAEPDSVDRLVLLASGAYTPLTRCKARKLFIMARNDIIGDNQPRLPGIRQQYERASEPKQFVILEGSAHAQAIFATNQGTRLTQEILRFVSIP